MMMRIDRFYEYLKGLKAETWTSREMRGERVDPDFIPRHEIRVESGSDKGLFVGYVQHDIDADILVQLMTQLQEVLRHAEIVGGLTALQRFAVEADDEDETFWPEVAQSMISDLMKERDVQR